MTLRELLLAGGVLAAMTVGGMLAFAPLNGPSLAQAELQVPPAEARQLPESQTQLKLSFAPVVRSVAPSVVNVYATRIEQQVVSPFANDPFFSRFFGQGGLQSRPRESGA